MMVCTYRLKTSQMICSAALLCLSCVVFGFSNLYFVSYLVYFDIYSTSLQHLFSSFVVFVASACLLGLQVDSDCTRGFSTWGAVSFVVIFCVFMIELSSHSMVCMIPLVNVEVMPEPITDGVHTNTDKNIEVSTADV